MLQLAVIRENPEFVIERLAVKHFNATELINQLLVLDANRRESQKKLDDILAESNKLAKEIGNLFKAGKKGEADGLKNKTAELKKESKDLEDKLSELEEQIKNILLTIPNIPDLKVPAGRTATDNKEVHKFGIAPKFDFQALPHWDLCNKYDIIDFELGNKITGAGFPVYKGKGARLQRALINFFLDEAIKAGYTEFQPPYVVNEASGYGTGQLPDKEGQMYQIGLDNLYLIPTAEVPITNLFRDTILKKEELPIKSTAYSACFRREAGSYGKDVRGLNRLHQFDKVEIVLVSHPETSYHALEEMRAHVAGLIEKLELPYRIVALCGGDMSFASAFTYDFEVYAAAQDKWLEVSSVSNFESFQSNRLKLRFKDGNKTQLAHTLNGSALALPRIVAALLENHQTPQGIKIPKVLVPYTGFEIIN